MKKFNYFVVFIALLFINILHADVTVGWQAPFNGAIRRLKEQAWEPPIIRKTDFDKTALKMLDFIKKHHKDWKSAVNPDIKLHELAGYRDEIIKLGYVSKIFSTKAGTLVFQMRDYPNIIVKIDNRPNSAFDNRLRSYFAAYQTTQDVQSKSSFSHLYLPLEYGRDSQEVKARLIFSEKIPLFSDSEIDNMVLLILLHQEADKDAKLKNQMTESFKQMVNYVCKVNFDDINFRNVPFAVDGRLAPFDTDSFTAATGINSFLSQFHGYKLIKTSEDLKPIIGDDCHGKIRSSGNTYKNLVAAEKNFSDDVDALKNILTFLAKKTGIPVINIDPEIDGDLVASAGIINSFMASKIASNPQKNLKLFGKRCEHARDIVTNTADQLAGDLTIDERDNRARRALEKGKENGVIMTAAKDSSIMDAMGQEGLRGFICF